LDREEWTSIIGEAKVNRKGRSAIGGRGGGGRRRGGGGGRRRGRRRERRGRG